MLYLYKTKFVALLTIGIGFLGLGGPVNAVEKEVDRASVYNSLQLVESILVNSSVAERVQRSNSQEATRLLDDARKHYQRSQAFMREDRADKAIAERDLSLKLVMKAARLANKGLGGHEVDQQEDYESRLASVEVLMAAHTRISQEKNNQNLDQNLTRVTDPYLRESKNHAQQGDYQQAMLSLDKAYAMVTSSIENQRAGETLVRSLDFQTKEEEYDYELGRYENYLTLVKMLKNERNVLTLDSTSKPIWDKAHQHGREAEAFAQKGRYDQAIAQLDQASQQLVNLIRYAGVYIPGG
ncbi:MAG: hypothetical protein RI556_10835 [Hydrogenovibrio sp.]|uniref:hypothetical protein n=1 Tax=Hydrogenovibrio sp. TaxID=2065821 RepID=UPI002870B125|nr:hypothetical protein [Hydrogenovibrio sp.]MDR9499660.1 hypothetical protein [Hydrogenovibrio sp.]